MFLILIIKALFGVYIVGLVGLIVVWIKDNIFTKEEKQSIKEGFSEIKNRFHNEVCSNCGETQKVQWKICPYCGKHKELENTQSSDNTTISNL